MSTCKDCKFYFSMSKSCMLVRPSFLVGWEKPIKVALSSPDPACQLIVAPDFGCNQYEQDKPVRYIAHS